MVNLRDVSRTVNMQNRRSANKRSKSGSLGASFSKGHGWAARIRVNGKNMHIGYYQSAEIAHHAYVAAKRKLHEGCEI